MIHFPKGGNWKDQFANAPIYLNDLILDRKASVEGLPDRWVKIIEMNARKFLSENPEPEVDCVKEGLWVW